MSLLFESIRVQDGVLQNLEYHNFRMNHSRKALYKSPGSIELDQVIQVPTECRKGLYKCKVTYSREVKSIEFKLYLPRVIKSLRLIEDDTINYKYKYTNRGRINALLTKRERFDEILIIKAGFITDTSYSNIIFFDGVQWLTPSTPLLRGTMRSFLIENNLISETEIKVTDLKLFKKARLINAMMPFELAKDIKIEKIGY
ncbi:MAG: aminotransferase class IV family protein [Lentimicrobiaceae bacterium]